MTPEQGVRSVIAQAAAQLGGPQTPAMMAARFAGGTRALATELGVSQRTVQRWIRYEQGGGGEGRNVQRSPQRGPVQQRADAQRDREAIAAIRERGAPIAQGEMEVEYAGDDEGEREFEDIEPDWNEMLDEFEAGDEEAAAQAFQTAILEAYGAPTALTITDVELSIHLG